MGRSRTTQRVNLKAVIGTIVVVLVLVGGGLLTASVFQGRVRSELLSQSEVLVEEGKRQMALRHLEQYLDRHPNDLEVLDRFGRLLAESVLEKNQGGRLDKAIAINERLIRLDPDGTTIDDPQQNRRWLAELLILKSDQILRDYAAYNLEMADQRAVEESRYGAAEAVARELIDRGADDAEAHRLLAMAQQGNAGPNRSIDEAVTSYREALSRDPGDPIAADRLARLYRDRPDDLEEIEIEPDAADQVLDRLVQAVPESPSAWLVRYGFYAESSTPEGDALATEALNRAIEIEPDDFAVVLAAANDAASRGERERARELLDRLPESRQDLPAVAMIRATVDFQDGKSAEGIARLREALGKVQGADADLVYRLANALVELKDLAGALPLIERYRRLVGQRDQPKYHFLLGRFYQESGKHDEAIEAFRAAERELDGDGRARMIVARSRSMMLLGQKDEVIEDLKVAVRIAPSNPLARLALATAIAPVEGIERALAELREGIVRNPDSLELRELQIRLLLLAEAAKPADRRSWNRFITALNDARQREAIGDAPGLVLLNLQRQRLDGRPRAALALLEDAVEQHPDSEPLWTAWARLLIEQGENEQALAVLERASKPEAAGDLASFRITRAQILAQLGRGREAVELLAEAASTLPNGQRVLVLPALGRMHIARGRFDEARAAFTSWKRLLPGSTEPLLALLQLAIDTGDIAGAEDALREMRGDPGRPPGLPYQLGLAEYLIRVPGDDKAGRTRRALEALEPILGDGTEEDPGLAPELASALLLRGLAHRQLGELDDADSPASDHFERALSDLRAAWEQGERKAAAPMIDLLVRLDRFEEIDGLPRLSPGAGFDPELDRLAAEACLRQGRVDLAADYLERAGQAPAANTPQFASWRLAMLDRLGRTSEVEQSLRAQAENRNDAPSWVALIRYQAARGQREGAERSIAEMKRRVESDAPDLLEAQAFEAIGDLEAADAAYEAILDERPDDHQALLLASRFDRSLGRRRQALDRVEHALAVDPSSRPAARFKALLLAELSGDAESWQAAWDALGPEPSEGDAQAPPDRLARAIVLTRHPESSRRDEAVGRLKALIGDQPATDPLASVAREALAQLLLQQGRPDRAAEVASVTAISGTNPSAVALYTRALIEADRIDEAARQLDRLRNLSPDAESLTDLELRLVEARAEAGSVAEDLERAYFDSADEPDGASSAEATFRRLAQLGESAIEPTERVARDLGERFPALSWMPSQWFAARDLYPQALELAEPAIASDDPDAAFQAARAVLTVVDRSQGDPGVMDRAAELIEQAAARNDQPATKAVLAMLRHFQGRTDPSRFDDEIRIYRELLESNPNEVVYLNNLAWALSEAADQPDEALELIDRALEQLGAPAPELLDTRGVILTRLGRLDEAIATLDGAARERPNSPLYLFHLAQAHAEAEQADEARDAIARALELGLVAEDLEPFERETFERLKSL